jgi:hypothetical protein
MSIKYTFLGKSLSSLVLMPLLIFMAWTPLVALKTETSSALDISKEQKPSKSSPLQDWLPFAGTIGAAMIAGVFGIYQLQRSSAAQRALEQEKITAQRALEQEKLVIAQKESELAKIRADYRQYKQAQVLPFLEQLDKTLNESYKTAYLPPYFPDLGGYIPQLRRFSDQSMSEWLQAVESMSRYRMRLLLVLSQEQVKTVMALLTDFIDHINKILEIRNQVWFKQASQHELWDIHRSYVRIGYQLMMEIRDAISSISVDQTLISETVEKQISETLAVPLEKSSAVSLSYGFHSDFSWVAIWEVSTNPNVQKFVESMTKTTHKEFEEKLIGLTKELSEQGSFLDVKLMKMSVEKELEVFCIAVLFSGKERLNNFLEVELENYRQAYPVLWSGHASPIEIIIGLEKKQQSQAN